MTSIAHVFQPTPNPYLNPIFPSFSFHISSFQLLKIASPLKFSLLQARQWRRLEGLNPFSPAAVTAASHVSVADQGSAAADVEGSSSMASAQRRYHTSVGLTPLAPSHPRLAQRAPLPKRARTLGPGESSTSRPQAPLSPPYQGVAGAPDSSPASIIRRPYFPCSPIQGNVDCRGRDFHGQVYYDLPAFSGDPELRDSMLLVQRYHLEPFMMPRRFYYP